MAAPIVKYTIFRDVGISADAEKHSYVVKDERMLRPIVRDEGLEGLALKLAESKRLPGDDFSSPEVNHAYRSDGNWYRSVSINGIELGEFVAAYAEATS